MAKLCMVCGRVVRGFHERNNSPIEDVPWACSACQQRAKNTSGPTSDIQDRIDNVQTRIDACVDDAYVQGYSEGMVEGLILAAEVAPAVQVRLKDLLHALEQNNAPTLEGSRYMANAIRNALTDAGVELW